MQESFLVGERVCLRPLEREDASRIVSWLNNPQVTQFLGEFFYPADEQAVADGIERLYQQGHDLLFGILCQDGERLIGIAELHHLDLHHHQLSFGLVIGEVEEWNKGYGAEVAALLLDYAFQELGMNRVWLHVDEHNARGIRAYEKLGFQREGLLRQDRYQDGQYSNTVLMAVLRQEWQGNRGG